VTTQIIDSDLRCPRDGKRMMLEIGQEDAGGAGIGTLSMWHQCWHCQYQVRDDRTMRPLPTRTETAAARLKRLRLEGTELKIVYDDTPWPEEDW
jgi:hypothetical protein